MASSRACCPSIPVFSATYVHAKTLSPMGPELSGVRAWGRSSSHCRFATSEPSYKEAPFSSKFGRIAKGSFSVSFPILFAAANHSTLPLVMASASVEGAQEVVARPDQ